MPTTVPGMAKLSSVPNSNARLPAKFWRDSSQAVSSHRCGERRGERGDGERGRECDASGAVKCSPRWPPTRREAGEEMIEREGVVAADRLDEAADDRACVDDERQPPNGQRCRTEQRRPARQRHGQPGIAFAGDRGVGGPAEPALLRPERDQREEQQHDRQHCGTALVVRGADDGEEDLGRQHLVVSGEHQRVAEIGHALDEAEQERRGRPGAGRQGDGPERGPAARGSGDEASASEGLMPCTREQHQKAIGVNAELRDRHAGEA